MSRGKQPYVDIRGYNTGVTGSAIRNTVHFSNGEKYRFLVDYGMYQGEGYKGIVYNDSVNPKKINAVLLTHTHLDHDGALPIFMKKGYDKNIYMSEASNCLLDIGLMDSYRIMVRDSKPPKNGPILYSTGDIDRVMKNSVKCKYEQSVKIHENITVTFFNNGHLVGASMILVQIKEYNGSINLLYTGDYKPNNIFLDLKDLPDLVYNLENLTIVTESTYGSTESKDISYEWERNIIFACQQKRLIVLPALGQGRAQELMYRIRMLQNEGKIPRDYPVRVDGNTTIQYTLRYLDRGDVLGVKNEARNFLPMNVQFINSPEDRNFVLSKNSRQIIIATSGMGTNGPSASYIPYYLSKENAIIYFTCYLPPESTGYNVLKAEYGKEFCIGGKTIIKKAEMLQTRESSSHATADQIIKFINRFSPRSVLITHGEPMTKKTLDDKIHTETSVHKTGVLGLGYVYRVNSYGIDKAIKK